MSYHAFVTLEETRTYVAMMREIGVSEFSLGDLRVVFRNEGASPDSQHEHPPDSKPIRRTVGGLVPRAEPAT